MSVLDLIPGVAVIKTYARMIEAGVFVVAIVGIAGSMAWLHHDAVKAKAALVAEQAAHKRDLKLEADAATAGALANLAEGARRQADQSEINDETHRLASHARDAAVAADRGDAGVRSAFRSAAPRGCAAAADPGPVAVSQAASAASGDLRADVFGELDERAGRMAAALDLASIAGRACERSYDALTPTIAITHLRLGQ